MNYCSELSDQELVDLMQEDELTAFCEIYERYWKKLYGYAYQRLKDNMVVEELLQDFFTKIWVKRQTVTIKPNLASFLFVGIRNTIIDHYRKESVRLHHIQLYHRGAEESENSTDEYLDLADLTTTIQAQVGLLPEKCRNVFELSRNQNKTNKEIAMLLGISEKTVENQITKALKRLRLGLKHISFILSIILFMK